MLTHVLTIILTLVVVLMVLEAVEPPTHRAEAIPSPWKVGMRP
jgi:hypothetical protein